MKFSYVTAQEVSELSVKPLSPREIEALNKRLIILSARLSGWYPTLRARYEKSDENSPLRSLVQAMLMDAGRRMANNPSDMESETMGPYAYSRQSDSEGLKGLFLPADLAALEALLAEGEVAIGGSLQLSAPLAKVAVPTAYRRRPIINRYMTRRRGM